LAVLLFLLSLASLTSTKASEESFKHSQEIEKTFQTIGDYIEKFRQDHQRLPNAEEMNKWAEKDRFPFFLSGIRATSG